jgi:hypothetical protein
MKEQFSFEAEPFEMYPEFDVTRELFSEGQPDMEFDPEVSYGMPAGRQRRCPYCGASEDLFGDLGSEQEVPPRTVPLPPWVSTLKKLYDAGRLGWKAGRWIDKWTGRVFGKPVSERGADLLYKRLGRSRRAEDFVDSLPRPIRRWLYSL